MSNSPTGWVQIDFESFINLQAECFAETAKTPEYDLYVKHLDQLFQKALATLGEQKTTWTPFLLFTHKQFYAAAGIICRGQPYEADVVIRRLFEVVRLGVAFHHDPEFKHRYETAIAKRAAAWDEGILPGKLDISKSLPKDNAQLNLLYNTYKQLSESTAHANPELLELSGFVTKPQELELRYFSEPCDIAAALRQLGAFIVQTILLVDQWGESQLQNDLEFKQMFTAFTRGAKANCTNGNQRSLADADDCPH